MKITTKDIYIALFITLAFIVSLMTREIQSDSAKQITALQSEVAKLTRQVDSINTDYITTEMLQPALDDLARYEDKVDSIEDLAVDVLKQNREWSTKWNTYFEPYGRLGE
jgi:hypothetical protein